MPNPPGPSHDASPQPPLPVAARVRLPDEARALIELTAAVFAASLLGLASRHAFSVSFWPANAVLVGLSLRRGRPRALDWVGGAVAFVAADLVFGRPLHLAAFFAASNVLGSLTAALLLSRLDERDLQLRRLHSVLRILACLLPACLVSGTVGAALVRIEFGGSAGQTLMTWPASDLVNYLVSLPFVLIARPRIGTLERFAASVRGRPGKLFPAFLLAVSCVAAVSFPGAGNIMFPLPALLLCALTYSLSTMTVVTMLLGLGALSVLGLGIMDIGQDMSAPASVLSIRIAVAFLVLVPLTVSSALAVRDDLLDQLQDAADHDGLTGLLNRRAFEKRMIDRLGAVRAGGRTLAILWIDIDHFKSVNDRYGHLAGDAVLQSFAQTARACCRSDDLIGRLGGEEFALLAQVSGPDAAVMIAERLRNAFANQTVTWNGSAIRATVSIGACHLARPCSNAAALVWQLDEALYRAKRQGRNCVEWVPEGWAALDPGTNKIASPVYAVR